jgi:hypothetical protein
MTERVQEPSPPQTVLPPVEPSPEVARRNTILGLSLVGLVLLIAGGAVLVAFIYLHFD